MAQSQTGGAGVELEAVKWRDTERGEWYMYRNNAAGTLVIIERRDERTKQLIRAWLLDGHREGITDEFQLAQIRLKTFSAAHASNVKSEKLIQDEDEEEEDGEESTLPQSSSSQTISNRPTPRTFKRGADNYPILDPRITPIGCERTVPEIICNDDAGGGRPHLPTRLPIQRRIRPEEPSPIKVRKTPFKPQAPNKLDAIIRGGGAALRETPQSPPSFGLGRGKCLSAAPEAARTVGTLNNHLALETARRPDDHAGVRVGELTISGFFLAKIEQQLKEQLAKQTPTWKYPRLTCPVTSEPMTVAVSKRGVNQPWGLHCKRCDQVHKAKMFMSTRTLIYELIWVISKVGSLPAGLPPEEFSEALENLGG